MVKRDTADEKKGPSRDEYVKNKIGLLKWEEDNYTMLGVLVGPNGMHKMFDHSAIIYVCKVSKAIGAPSARLILDSDYDAPTDKPVCLLPNFGQVEKMLVANGMKEKKTEGKIVFELGYRVDAADLIELQKEEESLLDNANRLVLPVKIYPRLRTELEKSAKLICELNRKMSGDLREVVGNKMATTAISLCTMFVEAANAHIDMKKYLKDARVKVSELSGETVTLMNLRLIEGSKAMSILNQLDHTQKKIAGALEKENGSTTTS